MNDGRTEHEGMQVAAPGASLAAARLYLRAAEYLLWEQPGECAPGSVPGLIQGTYGAVSLAASIVACLAGTDVDEKRRGQLRQISARMGQVLADFRELSQPGP